MTDRRAKCLDPETKGYWQHVGCKGKSLYRSDDPGTQHSTRMYCTGLGEKGHGDKRTTISYFISEVEERDIQIRLVDSSKDFFSRKKKNRSWFSFSSNREPPVQGARRGVDRRDRIKRDSRYEGPRWKIIFLLWTIDKTINTGNTYMWVSVQWKTTS